MKGRKIKIGCYSLGADIWPAGHVFFRSLLEALREARGNDLIVCLLQTERSGQVPDEIGKLIDEVIVTPAWRRWTLRWAVARGVRVVLRRDLLEEQFLRHRGVDVVVFGEALAGNRIPALTWLPDFQHLRLPEMFSADECEGRTRTFRRLAERSSRVLLLSESVRLDFEEFAPDLAGKARVVSPVSSIPRSVYEHDPRSVTVLYQLPEKFLYLPNQFWKHKNHIAVFRALKILKDRGNELFLVCTGYPGDYRHPAYFSDLLGLLSQWGIRNQVAFLGLLPLEHMFMLIRQSIGVVNPSLFEGYGMTVDEARSVGKQVILSDIPAHREQNPPHAIYFDPHDFEDLAGKLLRIWRDTSPGPDLPLEAEARASLPRRRARCAESFMAVIEEVVGS